MWKAYGSVHDFENSIDIDSWHNLIAWNQKFTHTHTQSYVLYNYV